MKTKHIFIWNLQNQFESASMFFAAFLEVLEYSLDDTSGLQGMSNVAALCMLHSVRIRPVPF